MSAVDTSTSKTRKPRHIRQGIDPEQKAKLAKIAADGRVAELVRRDATQFLRRATLQAWHDFYSNPLPMGPALLPKTERNIADWRKLTPEQQATKKAKDIAIAKAAAAEAKAKRKAVKESVSA